VEASQALLHRHLIRTLGTLSLLVERSPDGYVVTVLTDAPQSTAEAVAAHLPREADPFWSRLSRGARRGAAAGNPVAGTGC
jgi:hypothetical protein